MAIEFVLVFPYSSSDTLPPNKRDNDILEALELIAHPNEPGEWVPDDSGRDDESRGMYYYFWDEVLDEQLFRDLVASSRDISIHRETNDGSDDRDGWLNSEPSRFCTVRGAIRAVRKRRTVI